MRETLKPRDDRRMRRIVALVTAVAVSNGCSWVFMDKPESEYASHTQPQCSDSSIWPTIDVLFALSNIGYAAFGTDGASEEQKTGAIIGGVVGAVVHLASMGSGLGWASDCRKAKADFTAREYGPGISASDESRRRQLEKDLGARKDANFVCSSSQCFGDIEECTGRCEPAPQVWCAVSEFGPSHFLCGPSRQTCLVVRDDSRERFGECVKRSKPLPVTPEQMARRRAREAAKQAAAPVPTPSPLPATPRGFFCSSSPSNAAAGFCARDKAECQRTRDAAIVGVVDLVECSLTETAWCAEKRCAPTEEACIATRARLGSDAEECIEDK